MGQRVGPFRLPLVPLTDDELARVLNAVREAGSLVDLAVADPA
jgi:dihydrodipicolinate synthase/N-acetylneuraminate lyase